MTPELWQRAQALFLDALDQPAAERAAWLENACATELELLGLLQSMLATDAKVSEHSVIPASIVLQQAEQPELKLGEELGPYRIVSFLGAGGMGQVFRAERIDGVVKQVVAVKLLRHSASAAELRRRFAIERRILARLNHPGIARFIDAGADATGRPYVVMELIDGVSITAYAKAHALSLRARLQLFLQVLEAVSYAHAQLIVHRDIKPGNVMVDASGAPRLLDFGIAKPLSDIDEALRAEGATETTMRAFSLKYAAPEQLKGEAIGLGCDVYALGGLLYELLTGQPALELQELNMLKAQERIFLQMPTLPSARTRPEGANIPFAQKELKGDLDRIVLHALKKEPQERYATIDGFAVDIRSHLNQEPISLRSSVRGYRLWKFVQRYKLPVAIGTLLLASLVGLVITLVLSNIAIRREKSVAQSEQKKAEKTTNFMLDIFRGANPELNGGQPPTAKDLARIAGLNFRSATDIDSDLRQSLLPVLIDVQYGLGDYLGSVELGTELIRSLPKTSSVLGSALVKRANAYYQLGSTKFAEADLERLAKIPLGKISYETRANAEYVKGQIRYRAIADIRSVINNYQIAENLMLDAGEPLNPVRLISAISQARMWAIIGEFSRSREIIARLVREVPDQPRFSTIKVQLLAAQTYTERKAGNFATALNLAQEQLKIATKFYGRDHFITGRAYNDIAIIEQNTGNFLSSDKSFQETVRIFRVALPADNPKLAGVLYNYAMLEIELKENLKAIELVEEAFRIASSNLGIKSPTTRTFAEELLNLLQTTDPLKNAKEIQVLCSLKLAQPLDCQGKSAQN